MKMICAAACFGVCVACPSHAGPRECRDATDQYNAAVEEVSKRLGRYANCISNSQRRNDCSTEFRRLRAAQDYELAVSQYGTDCR
jgi:hypothetical protein